MTVKNCVVCGKEFALNSKRAAKYCSDRCRDDARLVRLRKTRADAKTLRVEVTVKPLTAEERAMNRAKNISYAETQKQKTLSMLPKIEIPSNLRGFH